MAIAVTFTPLQGAAGTSLGTVSAALTGLASSVPYIFTVVGPYGTYTQNASSSGTTYTLVFPIDGPGSYTLYTQLALVAAAAVPSGVFTNAAIN